MTKGKVGNVLDYFRLNKEDKNPKRTSTGGRL
jgi:hypothetical protein